MEISIKSSNHKTNTQVLSNHDPLKRLSSFRWFESDVGVEQASEHTKTQIVLC